MAGIEEVYALVEKEKQRLSQEQFRKLLTQDVTRKIF